MSDLIKAIAQDQGFDDVETYLDSPDGRRAGLGSTCPGICRECKAVTEPHEPDAEANYCDLCGEQTVVSLWVLILQEG